MPLPLPARASAAGPTAVPWMRKCGRLHAYVDCGCARAGRARGAWSLAGSGAGPSVRAPLAVPGPGRGAPAGGPVGRCRTIARPAGVRMALSRTRAPTLPAPLVRTHTHAGAYTPPHTHTHTRALARRPTAPAANGRARTTGTQRRAHQDPAMAEASGSGWQTGLFGMFDDLPICASCRRPCCRARARVRGLAADAANAGPRHAVIYHSLGPCLLVNNSVILHNKNPVCLTSGLVTGMCGSMGCNDADGACLINLCVTSVLPCIYFVWRKDIRNKFGISGDAMGDCVACWCCRICANMQDSRELKIRGVGYQNAQMKAGMSKS